MKQLSAKSFLTAALLLLSTTEAGSEPLAAPERRIFLTQMRNTMSTVSSVKMHINQKRVLKVFMDELNSKGVFYFKIPGKLRWETLSPFKTILIYNDKQVAKFNFEDGKWRKLDFAAADIMAEVMSNIIDWTRGKFDEADENYDLQVYPGYNLVLKPRAVDMQKSLTTIELNIDPKSFHIKKVMLNEPKGNYVEITFSQAEENLSFNDRLFDLKSPSN